MNSIDNLINEFNVPETTAKQIIEQYTSLVGRTSGVNTITDVNYTGDGHRDIELTCSLCGKVTHMDYARGRNKLKEIRKTCDCQKSPKIKKDPVLRNDDPKYIGRVYGDYVVRDIHYVPHKNKSGGTNMWLVQCMFCKETKLVAPSTVKDKDAKCKCSTGEKASQWVGKKYNRLTVLSVYWKNGSQYAHCICDCGNYHDQQLTFLKDGRVKSCGCLAKELLDKRKENAITTSPLYSVWSNMIQRCYNPQRTGFDDYGGRGITVCDDWKDDFKSFETWAIENGYRPNEGLSLDRIDVNGNYEPGNCRWTNVFVQNVNRRKPKPRQVKLYEIDGEQKTLKEWCQLYGIWEATVRYRVNKMGMSLKEALTAEKQHTGNHFAALNIPESKAKQLERLNSTNSYIEANLYMAFIRADFALNITSQQQIGSYRVDFLVENTNIVIECDGLEYHKDKEQLKKDYERERYLVMHGYRVLRYTGSEINKDPDAVAKEIIDFVRSDSLCQDQQMTEKERLLG